MPPNFNELPIPKVGQNKDDINENHVKKLLTNKKKEDLNSNNSKKINKNFEDTILEKIKNN